MRICVIKTQHKLYCSITIRN